ncbi:septum site determining protein MinC [Salinisphaera sp. PC39]|uniref:septum site-determining protein MinC n=1 Tax=Salinisphaera sp. PC39 TaxID=1304156 RepID=UPI0033413998
MAFKGRMLTLTVLAVGSDDPAAVAEALDAQIARSPDFFRRMPVLLELGTSHPALTELAGMLRERELVPVAVLGGDETRAAAARAAGLGVIDDTRVPREKPSGGERRERTRLIDRPVRSGQQIYARDADLVITAAVSEGAEVLADGHIHVYGALRGRALAGASGDTGARIFCRRFEADLVAVAGNYKVADDIDDEARGAAVQIRLDEDGVLHIDKL